MNNNRVMVLTEDEEYLIRRYRKANQHERSGIHNDTDIKEYSAVLIRHFADAPSWKCRFEMIQAFENIKDNYEKQAKVEKALDYGRKQSLEAGIKVVNLDNFRSYQSKLCR